MRHAGNFSHSIEAFTLLVFCAWILPLSIVSAAEEGSPEFKSATFLGGTGDQGAGQLEMGAALSGSHLYLSGADRNIFGGQALALKHLLPPGPSPMLRFHWPNLLGNRNPEDEVFCDVAAGPDGLYFAGRSWSQTVDKVGSKEHKAVLVKFPLGGATGSGVGGCLWVAKPAFFPYAGNESFMALALAAESGGTMIYCAGRAQANGANNTAVLAKFGADGSQLWVKMLGDTGYTKNSFATAVAVANGHIYVAGSTSYPYTDPGATRLALWKLDPAGNLVMTKTFTPALQPGWTLAGLAVSGSHLYLVSTAKGTLATGSEALVLKCDLAGNPLWTRAWGGAKDEAGIGVAASENRVYAVGHTASWTGGGTDCFLLELNAADGEVVSTLHYGGAANDRAMDVLLSGQDLYVAGESRSFQEGGNGAGQSDLMLLRYALTSPPPPLRVTIDIKPGELPNPVNPKSRGNIPVAILSTSEFDAPTALDRGSLTFGREGTEKSLLSANDAKPKDIDGDGRMDLVCHFDAAKTGFQVGDTKGTLLGKLVSGRPIVGSDSVKVVGGEKPAAAPSRVTPAPIPTAERVRQPAPAPAATSTLRPQARAPSPVALFIQSVVRRFFPPPQPAPASSRSGRR